MPYFRRLLKAGSVAAALVLLSACSVVDRWVYKIDIPQGSHIDQEQLKELRVGMSKPQVEFLLGSPLMTDSFDDSRWYYVYRLQEGKTGNIEQKQLTLVFADGKLENAQTDLELGEQFYQPYEF